MEHIGKVYGPGPAGEVLVRAERPWRWGEGLRVVDRRGRALGRVESIIGPAAAPWLVLRPLNPSEGAELAARAKGQDAYLEELPAKEGASIESRKRTKGRPTGHGKGRERR